jgi:hypothetical protein
MVSHPQQEDSRADVFGNVDSEFLQALPEARRGVTRIENEKTP